MSSKHTGKQESASLHQAHRGVATPAEHLKGVCRLVNPPNSKDPEAVLPEQDSLERDYVGRLLHVADEALHTKSSPNHRKRRGRVH